MGFRARGSDRVIPSAIAHRRSLSQVSPTLQAIQAPDSPPRNPKNAQNPSKPNAPSTPRKSSQEGNTPKNPLEGASSSSPAPGCRKRPQARIWALEVALFICFDFQISHSWVCFFCKLYNVFSFLVVEGSLVTSVGCHL